MGEKREICVCVGGGVERRKKEVCVCFGGGGVGEG